MSRGRGGGRAGRGGGGGPQGKARGGRGGGPTWPGEGRRLDESEASQGSFLGGRGRGRGRPMRGMGLRAAGQNAVGHDYGTPQRSGQQTPTIDSMEVADEEDDIVLETHRKYNHIVKPHMEAQEELQAYQSSNQGGIPILVPPSVSNLQARAPSNLVALQRAQRAMEGQVAALIPTGPKSAQVHRIYGTLDAVHFRNRQQHQQRQQFPLPVSTLVNDKKKKSKFDRPVDGNADDPCLAGIPRPSLFKGSQEKFDHLGKSALNVFKVPVKFEKASGEWKDGAWIRSSDGKELATKASVEEAHQEVGNTSNPFDRVGRAGLGHFGQQAAPMQDDLWAMEREQNEEADDPIAALLKAHPGSAEMLEGEANYDDGFGYSKSSINVVQIHGTSQLQSISSRRETPTAEEAFFVDREGEVAISDEEDVILIPQGQAIEGSMETMQSDSEEERQLDAIIQHNEMTLKEVKSEVDKEAGFYVDLTGEVEGSKIDLSQYETTQAIAIGEASLSEVKEEDTMQEDSSEDEEVNLTQRQPRGQGKKARNAAKKARRRARKGVTIESEPAIAREGDSDLEWGSDGPPVKFRKQADQEVFVEGGAMEQLSLNVLSSPHDKEEEDEMLAVALANSVEKPVTQKNFKSKVARPQSIQEAILADYMENAMGVVDDDDDDDDNGNEGDVMTEQRDEKKVNKKTDLDALLQFMNGMDGQRKGRQMTLEDISIEEQMQEEEEWMTESEEEEEGGDEEEEEKKFDKAVQKAEERVMPNEFASEQDEQFDSDESDSSNEEEGPKKPQQETWSSTDDSDSDEDDAFDRHFSWANADEDFIKRLDKFAQANDSIIKGRDRKARNLLFKMIESGNFDNLDEEDMIIDEDDPVFGLGALQPVRRGKKAKKTWQDDHPWAIELQSQWEKDRAKKADNKRKRASERAAAAENPFHATQIKKGTKKMAKKAARAERRARERAGKLSTNHGGADDDDDDDDLDSDHLSRHASNMFDLDKQIQLFLRDSGKTTLSLAPMEKRARAQVHLLANCYNLTSMSKGSGTKRFPTLVKNQRSGRNVNYAKVNRVLQGCQGSFGSGYKGKDGNYDRYKVKDRASGGGAHVPKNQEGAAVGFGADRIGEDNIGHRLLTMMGWAEGSGVGLTKGAADPVGATIKVTKSGLGF